MRSGCLLASVLVLLGCGMLGSNHRRVGAVSDKLTPKAPPTTVRIVNGAGSVHVHLANGPEVAIAAEVWLSEGRPDTDFSPRFADHVRVTDGSGSLTIESAHLGASDAADWQLRLTVALPAGVALDLEQGVGPAGVELPETKGARVHVGTGSIAFKVPIVRGALAIDVGTGQADVEVGASGPTEGLAAECGTGRLSVRLPADVRGSFELRAATGAVEVDPRYGLTEERTHAKVESRGRVGEGGPAHSLRVGTGQVVLR